MNKISIGVSMALAMCYPRQVQEAARVQNERALFIMSVRTAGHDQGKAQMLYEEIIQAAQRTVYINSGYINIVISRVITMLERGDSYTDLLSWIQALPLELEYQWQVEAVMDSVYPGGPGKRFVGDTHAD